MTQQNKSLTTLQHNSAVLLCSVDIIALYNSTASLYCTTPNSRCRGHYNITLQRWALQLHYITLQKADHQRPANRR